jgi:phosphoglycolate phosphatase-like HAD superfamily hydrolase/ADP-ribose pyrophosphatase YjhB (NUDIX family)
VARIRNIIFDWCGTLVDDLPAVWRATNVVLRNAGVRELSLEEYRAEFELPFQRFYDRFTPGLPMAQLEAWYHPAFHAEQHSIRELPHARAFLEFSRAHGLRNFVLSSIHHEHFARHREITRLAEFIDCAYVDVRDKCQRIHELLREHQLDPRETVFVGDMQHDIEAARHGGVHSVGVLTGFNRLEQLRAVGPDLIVEHLGELREILAHSRFEFVPSRPAAAERLPVVTVGGLIFNDADEVLMLRTHKWSGLWGIPGGKTKLGETSEAALVRELKEETNLDITEIEFVLVQDCIGSAEFYRDAHFVLLNYTCRAPGRQAVELNEEAEEHRWLPLDEALNLPLNTPTRVLLAAVSRRREAAPA